MQIERPPRKEKEVRATTPRSCEPTIYHPSRQTIHRTHDTRHPRTDPGRRTAAAVLLTGTAGKPYTERMAHDTPEPTWASHAAAVRLTGTVIAPSSLTMPPAPPPAPELPTAFCGDARGAALLLLLLLYLSTREKENAENR